MIERRCEACRRQYEAASPRSKFCGNTCRSRAHRAAGGREGRAAAGDNVRPLRVAPAPPEDSGDGLVANLERQLSEAGRLDTWQGQGALTLARRIESGRDTGSAIASLHRELRAATMEALRGIGAPQSALEKHRDEIRRRRTGA